VTVVSGKLKVESKASGGLSVLQAQRLNKLHAAPTMPAPSAPFPALAVVNCQAQNYTTTWKVG
jgi:hypothetical protein